MLLMIGLTTLPVITVTWIATNNTRDSVEKEIINANSSRMLWADQYLDELIQQIDTLFYTLQINKSLMDGMGEVDSADVGVQYRTQNYIQNTLTSAYYSNSRKIDLLSLYVHASQKAFSVNHASSGIVSEVDIGQGVWKRLLKEPVNMYFKQSGDGIYAYHGIYRFEDQALLGGLSVRLNRDVWQEVGRILQSEPESSVFLVNDEGELLSGSTEAGMAEEVAFELRELGLADSELKFGSSDNYYYFVKRVDDGELTVIKAVPLDTVTRSAQTTIRAGIVTGALFAAASIVLSILVSLRISRPIVGLARAMRNAQVHNFELKSTQSRDEIGLLERGYNSMMLRIKQLIEDEYQREIDLKNAQLQALQAQINPHFLNNTLHLIGGMALTKGAPEIYKVTQVIGELLRYSIGTEEDRVPLADELKHMRNYLYIQENRFTGRCTVALTLEEAALGSLIPKFTLQPLLENAFEHGLQRKEGAWRIEVRVKRLVASIAIIIKDEGIGIRRDRLLELRAELAEGARPASSQAVLEQSRKRKGKGIGLKNVDTRLKLQFGSGSGVRLFSSPGGGTLAAVKLPIQNSGGKEHV
jgi:two-component system sensor histidine kinase YesM